MRRLRAAVAAGAALGVSGCGPAIVEPDDTAGDSASGGEQTGTGSGTSSTSTSGGAGVSVSSEADASAEADGGTREDKFDLGADERLDFGPTIPPLPPECNPNPSGCDIELQPGQALLAVCSLDFGGAECVEIGQEQVIDMAWDCLECSGFPQEVVCDPQFNGDSCCYWVLYQEGQSCPGRPFTVQGRARTPSVQERGDWLADVGLRVPRLGSEVRRRLADAWVIDAGFEAASVASFSRFVLELLSIGAPADLVRDAQQAMAEELEHARVLYGVASSYGLRSVGPGPLRVDGALSHATPSSIAASLAAEGCVAETCSALQLGVAASRARDPQLRARLQQVAEEELRHAELAWRALAWMLGHGDDAVRAVVAEVFANATEHVPTHATPADELDTDLLAAHGRLGTQERIALAQRALNELVAPAAADLLAGWTSTAPARVQAVQSQTGSGCPR